MSRRHSVPRPTGVWPAEMRAETAAAFCDEPSVEAFTDKVKKGIYCAPVRAKGCHPKWNRMRLDCDIARRHSLIVDSPVLIEDLRKLI